MTDTVSHNSVTQRLLSFSVISGYKYLLISLVLILLVFPLVGEYAPLRNLIQMFFSVLLITSLMAAVRTQKELRFGFVLVLIIIITRWAEAGSTYAPFVLFTHVSNAIFWVYVIVEILRDIFLHRKNVSADMIFGAISVYLLIGMLFAVLFVIVELVTPGSFNELQYDYGSNNRGRFEDFMYYSFVTITTLGYGDVLPLTPAARSLAYMEAVLGQVYLTVLVARLVGMHIAQKSQ